MPESTPAAPMMPGPPGAPGGPMGPGGPGGPMGPGGPGGAPGVSQVRDTKGTLRRMLAYFARERAYAAALLVVVALGCIFGVLAPAFQSQAIDAITASADAASATTAANAAEGAVPEFAFAIIIMLVLYMLNAVSQLAQGVISARLSTRIVGHMRNQLFGKTIDLPISYTDRHSHGDLMSRMTNDIEMVSLTITEVLPTITSGVLTLVGTVGIMLYFSWQLTLLSFVSVVLTVAATKFISARIWRYSRQRQTLLGQVNGQVEETVNGFTTVCAFNQQRSQAGAFEAQSDALTRAGILCESFGGVTGPVMNCISNIGFVIVAVFGGLFAMQGMITVGVISAFVVYAKQLGRPVENLSMVYGQLQAALAAAERVFGVLDEDSECMAGAPLVAASAGSCAWPGRPEADLQLRTAAAAGAGGEGAAPYGTAPCAGSPSCAGTAGPSCSPCWDVSCEADLQLRAAAAQAHAANVTFSNVNFSYDGKTEVLHDFTLTVPAGKKVALVGATGSGKTTVVSLLERFYDPTSGQICIDDQDIRHISRASLRQHVAIVLQESALVSETVLANLCYANPAATLEDAQRAARLSCCADMIEALPDGYNTQLAGGGAALSAGQRQLLSIARAFVANPRVLVLDEATSNVDTRTERAVQQAMQRIMRNRTSIVIAHRLSTIQDADAIVVMSEGRICEMGTHDELLAKGGEYARLYETQFAGQEI